MRVITWLGIALATTVIGGIAEVTQAVQLRDGTVYFVQPPELVEATTTFKDINVWGATYYFTLNLPQNAGEPLQRVTINQYDGTSDIRFDLEDSRAFVGTRDRKGTKLKLGEVTREKDTKTVFVTFDPPCTSRERQLQLVCVQSKSDVFRYLLIWRYGVSTRREITRSVSRFWAASLLRQ
jgi:hypothetical protein